MERALYYVENPQFGKKRVGRALGLVPPPKSANVHDKVMDRAREAAANRV